MTAPALPACARCVNWQGGLPALPGAPALRPCGLIRQRELCGEVAATGHQLYTHPDAWCGDYTPPAAQTPRLTRRSRR